MNIVKKLKALYRELCRSLFNKEFPASKFKSYLKLSISRLTVLKNQYRVRHLQARKDAAELLILGQRDRALLRVERAIEEQNMFDAFDQIGVFCCLLIDRLNLVQNEKACPDELKEAVSSLIFASSRCVELPELRKLRSVFQTRYGKDFIDSALQIESKETEVNPKMVQTMSFKKIEPDIRLQVLKEISTENGIQLTLEDSNEHEEDQIGNSEESDEAKTWISAIESDTEGVRVEEGKFDDESKQAVLAKDLLEYTDVAQAALTAYKAASQAEALAKVAVKLARIESEKNLYSSGPQTPRQGFSVRTR